MIKSTDDDISSEIKKLDMSELGASDWIWMIKMKSDGIYETLCNNIKEYKNNINPRFRHKVVSLTGLVYYNDTNILIKVIEPNSPVINLYNEIRGIGDYAFYGSRYITEVYLSPDTRTIGIKAFCDCVQLDSVMVGQGQLCNFDYIGDFAFENCKSLRTVTFIEDVKFMGKGVFCGCENLGLCDLPHSMEQIPEYSFCHCAKLKFWWLPKRLRKVCKSAFEGCSTFRDIDIPKRVRIIEERAFAMTWGLKRVRFHGKVKHIHETAFEKSGLEEIIVPFWLKSYYKKLFPGKKIKIRLY